MASAVHQILSGRRGTGKTHALSYLEAQVREGGDLAVYVDMRTIGSTGGLYGDQSLPISERGARLLCDTLGKVHDVLMDYALDAAYNEEGDTLAPQLLDRLGAAITDFFVRPSSSDQHGSSAARQGPERQELEIQCQSPWTTLSPASHDTEMQWA